MAGQGLHARIKHRLQTEGLGRTIIRALRAGRRRLIRHVILIYTSVDLKKPLAVVNPRVSTEFRWASSEETQIITRLMPQALQAAEQREGRNNDRHWVGIVEGQVAFITCVREEQEIQPPLQLWLGPMEISVYLRGSYTLPEYRGAGLMAAGWSRLFVILANEGLHYAWACARYENIPSLRSQIKAGMNIIAAESYWHVLGMRFGTEWT